MRLNARLYCYSVNSAKYLSIGLYQFRTNMVFRYCSVQSINHIQKISNFHLKLDKMDKKKFAFSVRQKNWKRKNYTNILNIKTSHETIFYVQGTPTTQSHFKVILAAFWAMIFMSIGIFVTTNQPTNPALFIFYLFNLYLKLTKTSRIHIAGHLYHWL